MKFLVSIFPMMLLVSSCEWMFQRDPHPHLSEVQIQQQGNVKRQDVPEKLIDPPVTKPVSYPTAEPIPGRPGLVLSPYNNRVIDCVGFAKGTLVRDPRYPDAEKKWFVVP